MHSHKLEKSRNLRQDDLANKEDEDFIAVDLMVSTDDCFIRNKCSSIDFTRKINDGTVE